MTPVVEFKLSPSYDKGHVLFWRLDPFYVVTGEEIVELEISGTPDFSVIRDTIPTSLTAFFVADDTNKKQGHGKDTFYRLKITTPKCTVYSKTQSFSASRYGRREYVHAREIHRKELLRARRFTGGEMYLLKRRVMDKPVKENPDIDPITGLRLTNENTSQSTVYTDGYFPPLKLIASMEDLESVRDSNPAGLGLQTRVQQDFRVISYPAIDTYDILVDPSNDQRYQVTKQQEYYYPGTDIVITQLVNTRLLQPTSEIYKIEIPRLV